MIEHNLPGYPELAIERVGDNWVRVIHRREFGGRGRIIGMIVPCGCGKGCPEGRHYSTSSLPADVAEHVKAIAGSL